MIRKFCDRCAKEIQIQNCDVKINISGEEKFEKSIMLCGNCQKDLIKSIKEFCVK